MDTGLYQRALQRIDIDYKEHVILSSEDMYYYLEYDDVGHANGYRPHHNNMCVMVVGELLRKELIYMSHNWDSYMKCVRNREFISSKEREFIIMQLTSTEPVSIKITEFQVDINGRYTGPHRFHTDLVVHTDLL